MSKSDFTLRPLAVADAPLVAALMAAQPPDYVRFFHVFGADEAAIAANIARLDRDVYAGLFWEGALICVFLLRGWDEGYAVPTFGLVVARDHRGREVLTVALEAARLIARMHGATRMMCKVHPDNRAATKAALRLGFRPDREEAETGNLVYYLEL
jgi:RimJ/RimL family protein N-acetyltransferase